jgi:hypothetical protein
MVLKTSGQDLKLGFFWGIIRQLYASYRILAYWFQKVKTSQHL